MRGLPRATPQKKPWHPPSNIASARDSGGSLQSSTVGKLQEENAHTCSVAPRRTPRRNRLAPGVHPPKMDGDVLYFRLRKSRATTRVLALTATSFLLNYPSHLHEYKRFHGMFCSRVWARNLRWHSTKFYLRREHSGGPA